MATYKDFRFEPGIYGKLSEYTDSDALILGVRNIMLSRPGNFPFHPSIGMDISKYRFDLFDDTTIRDIRSELNRQVAEYMPDLQNIEIYVQKVEADNGAPYLCIAVAASKNGEKIDAKFILSRDRSDVIIFNETR